MPDHPVCMWHHRMQSMANHHDVHRQVPTPDRAHSSPNQPPGTKRYSGTPAQARSRGRQANIRYALRGVAKVKLLPDRRDAGGAGACIRFARLGRYGPFWCRLRAGPTLGATAHARRAKNRPIRAQNSDRSKRRRGLGLFIAKSRRQHNASWHE